MKKRILTLVMVLVLMIAVSVVGVSADDVAPQAETGKQMWSHLTVANDGLTATGYCPHCGDDTSVMQTWTKLTLSATSSSISVTASGHYFLDADYEGKAAINLGAENVDVVLHLNGHTYKRAGNDGGSGALCTAKSNTTVSIVDDQDQKGTIHGSGGWAVYDYGAPSSNYTTNTEVNLYSGNLTSQVTTIPSGSSNSNGGTVCMTSGTFNMYGGTINGTKATNGGAIYTKAPNANAPEGTYAKVNISGGTINGGTATNGGAIYVSGGAQVTISGGTITGGTATSSGGNIYMPSTNCTLTITGGTIQNGKATSGAGGNICTNNGVFTLSGGAVTGGQAERGGNIYTNTGTDSAGTNNTTLSGGTVSGGKATYGGNLYINRKLTLGAVTFEKGTATYGSDIYASETANMTVDTTYSSEAGVYYHLAHLNDEVLGQPIVYDTKREDDDTEKDDINRCTGVFSGKLYLENETGAPRIYGYNGYLYVCNVALVGKDGSYNWYTTNADAVLYYDENTKYMQAGSGALALNGGDYVVDLAGNDVQITGTGTVTIFDSANDDYKTFGTATINGPTLNNDFKENVLGKDTYMVNNDGTYSFHRLGMRIEAMLVDVLNAGINYEGLWQCDEMLAAKVETFGVAVSVKGKPNMDDETYTKYTVFTSEDFEPGVTVPGVKIRNIVKDGAANNTQRSKMDVYAAAYVQFEGQTAVISKQNVAFCLYDALDAVEENLYTYWTKADDVKAFHDGWVENGVDWNFKFDLTEDELALLTAYSGRAAYHGEAHDHSASGGSSDGTYSLNQWKKSLKEEGLDFTTILDHRQWSHMQSEDWDSSLFIGGSEASTNLKGGNYTALENAGKSVQMHYSMIFPAYDATALNNVQTKSAIEKDYTIFKDYYNLFNYPALNVDEFDNNVLNVINAVKNAGGMFVHVHPKASGYLNSENIEDYYFADWTGLEVFYGAGGYAPKQQVSKYNYDLWTALLKAGKKIWATAGTDLHSGATTNALTTLYAETADAAGYFACMAAGNTTCGPVGIRMSINGALMGSQVETAFTAGQKVIFSVGDFHESAYNSKHTYSVKLYKCVDGTEVEVDVPNTVEGVFDASKPFCESVDVDPSASYYRVEVWDDTANYQVPIAIGNPIWNK